VKNLAKPSLRWFAACAGLAIAAGWSGASRADVCYSYAEQTVNGILVTGTGLTNANMTGTTTSASAVLGGSGVANNSPTDTLEAYVGALPKAPENFYSKWGTVGGGSPQTGDFSRGDAVLSGTSMFTTGGMNTSNVAETQVSSGGTGLGLATGNGNWSLAGTFKSTGTSVTIGYTYLNEILDLASGPLASAQSSYKFAISIKDQHGNEVDSAPLELNTVFSAPPNTPDFISSGSNTQTLSLTGMTAGDVLTISISGSELSSGLIAVPEPGSMALAGLGGIVVLAFRASRLRARKV